MRPHVLRFQGIGPYPDLVEIDFDQLTPLGLYLIIGPTGAGKSTIFDALSFALYGDVPSGRSIVSDHEHRESPMIEIEFSHRGVRYFVHREPGLPQTPTRKATNPKPNAQRFTKFTTTGIEELTVTGTKDVTKHVEDLLGLTIDQFNRVILIPQNEFQEFLLASDKEKSEILDALFGTEIYKIFADRLWDEAGKLKSKAEKAEVALGQKFANIEAAVESLIDQELIDEAVDAREDPLGLIAQISERAQKAEAEAEAAAQVLAQANATTALAAGEAQRFDAFQELQTFLGQREIDAPRIESAQSEIDRDQQARQVLSAEDEYKVAQESLFNAEAEVARLRMQLSELLSSHDLPVFSDFVTAFDSASPAQLAAELTKVINIIDQASGLYESVTQDRADMQVASNAALDANDMLTHLQTRQVELHASLVICRNTEEDAVKALKDQQVLKEQVDSLDAQLLRADVEGATAALTVATTHRDVTGKEFQVANDALTQARKLQALHMAGELARELVAEAPCPVCGSTEHPALAQPSQDASTEDLQTAYDAANNANALAESAVREATIALNKAQEEFATLPNTHEQSVLRDKLAHVVTLAASAGDLQSQIKELDVALTQVGTDLTTQTVRRSEAEAIISRLTNQIEKSLQVANDIMTEDSFDVAQPLVEQANNAIGQLLSVSEQVSVHAGAAGSKAQQLQDVLLANNFSDCDAARFALVLEATLDDSRKLIADFAQLQISITGLTGKVGDQPVPDIRPNLEDAEVSQQHAHVHHQALSAKANAYSQNLKIIASAQIEIETLGPETLELIQNSKDAYHIAQVMKTGKAPLLSVQRWVQKQMFIDVCEKATKQLQILTSHRFEILLNDGDARQGQSLEVCILDSYTGQVRPVKSMSGGEKFLTSLAMALALAEVVQSMSGGVEITSLFIDEGFGSLDRSTLDTAIDVLQKLQRGGRTVGVISHVEQMHEDIDIGIAVTPGARGSTLTVLPGEVVQMQALLIGVVVILIVVIVIATVFIRQSLSAGGTIPVVGSAPIDQAALVASVRSAVEAEMRKTAQETLQASTQQSAEFFAAQQRNIENQTRALLSPFEEQIKGLSGSVTALQTTYSQEQGTVAQLAVQITSLQSTTTTLTNSLKSPTARGSWGENQLRNVIQLAGMEPYCDYSEQFTGGAAEADQRPDVVVRLPNGALIAVDSKAPLSAYLRMQDASDVATKEIELKAHAKLMRDHMKKLADKKYWNQFPEAPDFVVMFIPGEGFVSDAMRSDPTLLDDAMKSRVLVASPINLLALLFAVAKGWQAHSIAEHANEIASLGNELYERVSYLLTLVSKTGNNLNSAIAAYNEMVGSLEGRMLPTLRKFRDLKVVQGDEIKPLKSIDLQTRPLNAPEVTPELN